MKRKVLAVGLALTIAVLIARSHPATAEDWTPPRTPDGHADFQGIWTTQTFTPLQRPDRYAGREFLTEAEAATLTTLLTQDGVDPLAAGIFAADDEERSKRIRQDDPTHYNNAEWLATSQPKSLSSLRTSLIVDPPDGRIPPMTPDAQKRAAARRAAASFDSYDSRPLQERCIVWTHEGPPMLPPPYNDIYEVLQAPGYVVLFRELASKPARIVPTDGRPHLPDTIRQWNGDSVGRWDGDTLVVDTTNFKAEGAVLGASARLHVVERFTRVAADRIVYRFTVDDPSTWTRPWSAEIPMLRADGHPYEYACHEGNYSLANVLRGARVRDGAPR